VKGECDMQNQKGSALVLVMLTVAALLIVGVSLVAASTVEYRSSVNHGHSTQAFFVAEAGLNWARRSLRSGTIALPVISVGQEAVLYRNAAFGSPVVGQQVAFLDAIGPVEVRVRRLTSTRVDITAQGRQFQSLRTVAIQADETAGAGVEAALARHQVNGVVDLGNHAIVRGDISGTSFVLDNHATIEGTRIVGSPLATFARPVFSLPTGLTPRGLLSVPEHGSASLLAGSSYTDVTVRAHGVLMINVPDTNDVVITVRNLSVRDHARINRTGTGTGRILLHIEQTMTLNSPSHVNASGHIDRMVMYYHGTVGLTLSEHSSITGVLVTDNAPVTIRSHFVLTGHVITGAADIDVDNHAVLTGVLYAPRARVDVGNHGRVDGVVIAGSLFINNHGQVNRAAGGIASFTPSVLAHGLWPAGANFTFHTWAGR